MKIRNLVLFLVGYPLMKWVSLIGGSSGSEDFDLSEALDQEISWSEFFETLNFLLFGYFLMIAVSLTVIVGGGSGE